MGKGSLHINKPCVKHNDKAYIFAQVRRLKPFYYYYCDKWINDMTTNKVNLATDGGKISTRPCSKKVVDPLNSYQQLGKQLKEMSLRRPETKLSLRIIKERLLMASLLTTVLELRVAVHMELQRNPSPGLGPLLSLTRRLCLPTAWCSSTTANRIVFRLSKCFPIR